MAKEMVTCPDCGKEVKALGLAAHKRIVHGEGIKVNIGKPEAPPDENAGISAPKNINLSGEDLGIADMLIRSGFAKDLNELAHKSLNFTNSNINRLGGGYKMEQNPKEETFEDIDRMKDRDIVRKYKELQIKAMEKEIDNKDKGEMKTAPPTPSEEDKIIQQMERQIRIKTMKKALDEGEFSLGKMMEMRMMDRMFGDTGKSSEVQALQNQLNSLQQQMQQERLVASQQLQNERVIQKIEQMGSQQPGMTAQDVLTFTTDKDRAVKEIGLQLQLQQEKATAEKLAQLQQQIIQAQQGGGLTPQRIQAFNEDLKAIKSMANELGESKKGPGEYISETITNLAGQLQPTLTKLIEQKQQQQQFPPYPQEQFPPELPPEQMQEYPHQSDLTSSEQQISDTMSDMYIKKRKPQQ